MSRARLLEIYTYDYWHSGYHLDTADHEHDDGHNFDPDRLMRCDCGMRFMEWAEMRNPPHCPLFEFELMMKGLSGLVKKGDE